MSTFNFNNGDFRNSVFGDNATVTYNQNLSPEERAVEVDKLLEQLRKEIAALAQQLPAAQAMQVTNDVETLAKEAKAPEPRKAMFEITGSGLVEAAKTVAAMTPSIVTTVTALGKLLFP